MNGALFARVAADGGDDAVRSIFWAEFDAERETAELVLVELPAWRVMLTGVAFHADAAIEIRENEEEEYVGKFPANNIVPLITLQR